MMVPYHVGQRVSFQSELCIVKYIGPLKGTEGEWLGVEWDDPKRGKNDGEHKGVRYFRCELHVLVFSSLLDINSAR